MWPTTAARPATSPAVCPTSVPKQNGGHEALEDVEDADENAPPRAERPADVRRPRVAGARAAQVDPEHPRDDRRRVDRAEGVADDGGEEPPHRRGQVRHAPAVGLVDARRDDDGHHAGPDVRADDARPRRPRRPPPRAAARAVRAARAAARSGDARCCTATSTACPSAASTARSSSRARALPAVRTCSSRVDVPVDDLQQRLDLQGLPDGGPRGADPAAAAQVLERVHVEVDREAVARRSMMRATAGRVRARARRARAADGREAQAHRDRARVDHVHRQVELLGREQRPTRTSPTWRRTGSRRRSRSRRPPPRARTPAGSASATAATWSPAATARSASATRCAWASSVSSKDCPATMTCTGTMAMPSSAAQPAGR